MPKKLSAPQSWPTLAQERLTQWGKAINTQRMRQRITVADLAARLGVSRTTLLRLEKGDPGAAAAAYLAAMMALGMLEQIAPSLPTILWQGDYGQRVKLGAHERGIDEEYF
ncbi:MAG: helix-turn-helix domain-containing protein [Massilia sp.]